MVFTVSYIAKAISKTRFFHPPQSTINLQDPSALGTRATQDY